MLTLGFDYGIRITTDAPLDEKALTEAVRAVNHVLAEHCQAINYDTQVGALAPVLPPYPYESEE